MHHQTFEWKMRVYLEDTDAFGVVYHSNYLCYAERARTEMMYVLGFDMIAMMKELNFAFAVKSSKMQHFKPAVLGDIITIQSVIEEMRGARCLALQTFYVDGLKIAEANIEVVCIHNVTHRPVRWPHAVVQKLLPYQLKQAA